MNEKVVRVGIADMKIVKSPNKIKTLGLGSCVGVVLYDPMAKIAGMAHIMLPHSDFSRGEEPLNAFKFANTAIQELEKQLVELGASKINMKAKIAGGAQMFQFSTQNDQMRVGPRNVDAVKKELLERKIQLVAEDTGGSSGRTIEFDPETSALEIRTAFQEVNII